MDYVGGWSLFWKYWWFARLCYCRLLERHPAWTWTWLGKPDVKMGIFGNLGLKQFVLFPKSIHPFHQSVIQKSKHLNHPNYPNIKVQMNLDINHPIFFTRTDPMKVKKIPPQVFTKNRAQDFHLERTLKNPSFEDATSKAGRVSDWGHDSSRLLKTVSQILVDHAGLLHHLRRWRWVGWASQNSFFQHSFTPFLKSVRQW